MRYRRYSYTSAEDDEEISERSVFYARTQYGVFAFASVYSDVRQGLSGRSLWARLPIIKGDACVREALMQADGGCARLALQKSFCGSLVVGNFESKFKPARTEPTGSQVTENIWTLMYPTRSAHLFSR